MLTTYLVAHAISIRVNTKTVTGVLMPLTFVPCPIRPGVHANPIEARTVCSWFSAPVKARDSTVSADCFCAPMPQPMEILAVVRGVVRPLAQSTTMPFAILEQVPTTKIQRVKR